MPNMQGGVDGFLGILGLTMSVFFPVWPLVIIGGLQRRKHILRGMTAAWVGMLIIWALSSISPERVQSYLIPEPLNTALFFVAGAVLVAAHVGTRYWQRRDTRIKADAVARVDDLHRLSPTDFENMAVEMFSAMGHKARRTGTVGDHGVDVEVQATSGEKWVVQCKRWRGSVGEPIVRDFHGMMQHEKADRGFIITSGKFTEQARNWATGKPITLLDGAGFLKHLKKTRQTTKKSPNVSQGAPASRPAHDDTPVSANKKTPDVVASPQVAIVEPIAAPHCPKCGGEMILRVAIAGPHPGEEFWGCKSFPQCRGTLNKR